jgi:hypothetical protein
MDRSERDELRRLVDEAKRGAVEKDRHVRQELRERSAEEIKSETAARKAILAAGLAHDSDLEQPAVIARRGRDVYLVSVGDGCARILDLRGWSASLSDPEHIYGVMAAEADWLPFDGDSNAIGAVATRMVDAAPQPGGWAGGRRDGRPLGP